MRPAAETPRTQPVTTVGALNGIVGFHLARASVIAYEGYERFIGKPFGLKKVEFSLLLVVTANGALAPKGLARVLAVTAPALTVLLDRLQARGLLRREPNPADRRSQHVLLTAAGRALAQQAMQGAAAMEAELRAGRLSDAEHAMLIELLDKLAAPR